MIDRLLYSFEGQSGRIELYETHLEIIRESSFNKLYGYTAGKTEIPLSDIATVLYKKGGAFADGYIQIVLKSDNGSVSNPYKAQNSIVFPKSKNVLAESTKDKILELCQAI